MVWSERVLRVHLNPVGWPPSASSRTLVHLAEGSSLQTFSAHSQQAWAAYYLCHPGCVCACVHGGVINCHGSYKKQAEAELGLVHSDRHSQRSWFQHSFALPLFTADLESALWELNTFQGPIKSLWNFPFMICHHNVHAAHSQLLKHMNNVPQTPHIDCNTWLYLNIGYMNPLTSPFFFGPCWHSEDYFADIWLEWHLKLFQMEPWSAAFKELLVS